MKFWFKFLLFLLDELKQRFNCKLWDFAERMCGRFPPTKLWLWIANKRPQVVVSSWRKADYKTIGDAIRNNPMGSRIFIDYGRYEQKEDLILTEGQSLIGLTGNPDTVVIDFNKNNNV